MASHFTFTAVGIVHSPIREPLDDVWGGVTSRIELDSSRFAPDCLKGLDEFSHVEIVFTFHRIPDSEVYFGARRPRGRADWPEVGIFAQRGKNRPNKIGLSTCRLVRVEGVSLAVANLDAIDGTPVLDIKPYIIEFGPAGEVKQPAWATELMTGYFGKAT